MVTRKLKILLIVSLIFIGKSIFSQSVSNIQVLQEEEKLIIKYDILSNKLDETYKINVQISTDGGNTYTIIPKFAKGNIGIGINPGFNKEITWEPLKEGIELNGTNYVVKVSGEVDAIPLEVQFVFIRGGSFEMGDNFGEGKKDEKPVHNVTLAGFEISKYEITNKQYIKFLNSYNSDIILEGKNEGEQLLYTTDIVLVKKNDIWVCVKEFEDYPVRNVTWFGANEFCKFYGYYLPTEAQWEYAARDLGKKFRFANNKDEADPTELNFNRTKSEGLPYITTGLAKDRVSKCGQSIPNSLGIYDMSGNVSEWCFDWYSEDFYSDSGSENPFGPWIGSKKSLRGGSYKTSATDIRCSNRSFLSPSESREDIGFRVVRIVK